MLLASRIGKHLEKKRDSTNVSDEDARRGVKVRQRISGLDVFMEIILQFT